MLLKIPWACLGLISLGIDNDLALGLFRIFLFCNQWLPEALFLMVDGRSSKKTVRVLPGLLKTSAWNWDTVPSILILVTEAIA